MTPSKARSALSILLVEDNEINHKVAEAFLTRAGHHVTSCFNGTTAVHAAANQDFDIVLMDIQMPDMDGLEATRCIRALADHRKAAVPILALTANCSREEVRGYLAAGMNGAIEKPLRKNTIDSALAPFSAPTRTEEPLATPIIDEQHLRLLAEAIEPQRLGELYELARRSILEAADLLRFRWREENGDGAGKSAHRLAGVASNFGCVALASVAREIECRCRNGADGRDMAPEFEEVLAATLARLPSGGRTPET